MNTMPIQAFSFPIPQTRFFQVGQHIYKFKIKPGSKISGEETSDSEFVSEELENAVRVVLMNLDNLHPFSTQHFNIFPYRSRWERVSELRFRKGEKKLFAYPFLITLYVEINEPIPSLTVNPAHTWVPSSSTFPSSGVNLCHTLKDREDGLDSPQLPTSHVLPSVNEAKRKRTEEPQEGPLSVDHHDKEDACLHLQSSAQLYHPSLCVCGRKTKHNTSELPNLSGSAEETVCDNEGSEYPEEFSPDATSPEISEIKSDDWKIVEQDSKPTERENPGVLARLARIAALPFSLLSKRS